MTSLGPSVCAVVTGLHVCVRIPVAGPISVCSGHRFACLCEDTCGVKIKFIWGEQRERVTHLKVNWVLYRVTSLGICSGATWSSMRSFCDCWFCPKCHWGPLKCTDLSQIGLTEMPFCKGRVKWSKDVRGLRRWISEWSTCSLSLRTRVLKRPRQGVPEPSWLVRLAELVNSEINTVNKEDSNQGRYPRSTSGLHLLMDTCKHACTYAKGKIHCVLPYLNRFYLTWSENCICDVVTWFVCVCVYMYACARRNQKTTSCIIPWALLSLQSLSGWDLQSRPGWSAGKPQGTTCLCFPVLSYKNVPLCLDFLKCEFWSSHIGLPAYKASALLVAFPSQPHDWVLFPAPWLCSLSSPM